MGCCSKDSVKAENPEKRISEYTQSLSKSKKISSKFDKIPVTTLALNDNSVYVGNVLDNKPHGWGTLEYKNGDIYEGEFVEGKKEGYGKWTDKEGNSYDGFWKNDKRNGEGIYKTHDGLTFEGLFENNKKQGKAIIKTPDNTKYICTYKDDMESGEAEFFFSNGDHALGYIKDGNLDKNGRYEFKNGDIYVGSFKNGLFHGNGYYKWNSDSSYKTYEGEYIEGKRHGQGKLISVDGRILCGKFKNSKLHGEVLEISPQGNQLKVLFDNGNFIKVIDKIKEKLDVREFIDESIINTTIFSDPDCYKKIYEMEEKKRAKLRIQVKSSRERTASLPRR